MLEAKKALEVERHNSAALSIGSVPKIINTLSMFSFYVIYYYVIYVQSLIKIIVADFTKIQTTLAR